MSSTRRCIHGGFLVGMSGWLPDEDAQHRWGERYPRAGCNHLTCSACGKAVTRYPGVAVTHKAPVDLDALESGNTSGAGLTATSSARLYACRCVARSTESDVALDPADGAPHPSKALPWRCGGHPALTLPSELDGDTVSEAGLPDLAAAALAGTAPADGEPWPAVQGGGMPASWLANLYALVPAGAARVAIAKAVGQALGAKAPVTRAAALDFYLFHPTAPGADAVATRLRDASADFVGVPQPWYAKRDLADLAWSVLTERLHLADDAGKALDQDALAFSQASLLAPGQGKTAILRRVGALDPAWTRDNGPAIIAANPKALVTLIDVTKRWSEADAVALAKALSTADGVDHAALKAAIESRIHGDRGTKLLAAI